MISAPVTFWCIQQLIIAILQSLGRKVLEWQSARMCKAYDDEYIYHFSNLML